MHMQIGDDPQNGAKVMFLLPGYPFQFIPVPNSPQNVWLLASIYYKIAKVNGYMYLWGRVIEIITISMYLLQYCQDISSREPTHPLVREFLGLNPKSGLKTGQGTVSIYWGGCIRPLG